VAEAVRSESPSSGWSWLAYPKGWFQILSTKRGRGLVEVLPRPRGDVQQRTGLERKT
jgi:hypothetical protein